MEYTYFEANESTKGIPLIKQEYRIYGGADLNKINHKSQFFYEMCKAGYTRCINTTDNDNILLEVLKRSAYNFAILSGMPEEDANMFNMIITDSSSGLNIIFDLLMSILYEMKNGN